MQRCEPPPERGTAATRLSLDVVAARQSRRVALAWFCLTKPANDPRLELICTSAQRFWWVNWRRGQPTSVAARGLFQSNPDGHAMISTPRKQTFGATICRQLRAYLGHSMPPTTCSKADTLTMQDVNGLLVADVCQAFLLIRRRNQCVGLRVMAPMSSPCRGQSPYATPNHSRRAGELRRYNASSSALGGRRLERDPK